MECSLLQRLEEIIRHNFGVKVFTLVTQYASDDCSELQLLGYHVAPSTAAQYMYLHPKPPSQNWRTFLSSHACLPSSDSAMVHSLHTDQAMCQQGETWIDPPTLPLDGRGGEQASIDRAPTPGTVTVGPHTCITCPHSWNATSRMRSSAKNGEHKRNQGEADGQEAAEQNHSQAPGCIVQFRGHRR